MSDEFDSWKKDSTPYTTEETVCLDRKLVADFEAAVKALDEATRVRVGGRQETMLEPPTELVELASELGAKVAEKSRKFVFKAIGKRAWRKLIGEHPPTEDPHDKLAGYNIETFVPAALSAACIEPGLTKEQADWLINGEGQDEGVIGKLIKACFDANVEGGDEKKAVATAAAALSRMQSTPR